MPYVPIDTNSPLGSAIFAILGAVAQLERDLIIERVKNGLANAKAKGIKIGRVKTRPSELIRTLRRSGLTYRQIGIICKCSSGAVGSEIKLMKAEILAGTISPFETNAPPKINLIEPSKDLASSNEAQKVELDYTRY